MKRFLPKRFNKKDFRKHAMPKAASVLGRKMVRGGSRAL